MLLWLPWLTSLHASPYLDYYLLPVTIPPLAYQLATAGWGAWPS